MPCGKSPRWHWHWPGPEGGESESDDSGDRGRRVATVTTTLTTVSPLGPEVEGVRWCGCHPCVRGVTLRLQGTVPCAGVRNGHGRRECTDCNSSSLGQFVPSWTPVTPLLPPLPLPRLPTATVNSIASHHAPTVRRAADTGTAVSTPPPFFSLVRACGT